MTRDSKHTPGPWGLTGAPRSVGAGFSVWQTTRERQSFPQCIATVAWRPDAVAEEANARLIAAAPAMYEALRQIKERKNQVCANFELCTHPVCASSYEAFAIADAALALVEQKDGGR